MPTSASNEPSRSFAGELARGLERAALDLEELAVLELRPQRARELLAEDRARRPPRRGPRLEIRRSARSGAQRLDGARPDVDRERRRDHARQERHATSRARARSAWSSTSTQSTCADRRDADPPAAVGELLEAVLVVETGIAPPGGLERLGQPAGGLGLDQRDADVLALRGRGVERLVDPVHEPVRREMELHLLLAQRLLVVHREHEVRTTRLEHALLDRGWVHRVAVHEHGALGQGIAARTRASTRCSTPRPSG